MGGRGKRYEYTYQGKGEDVCVAMARLVAGARVVVAGERPA
jgi:hypothetical protein